MLNKLKLIITAVAITAGGSASAATFDFVELIDGVGGIGESTWDGSSVSGGWTVEGITVDASGTRGDAYLDAGTAGLGVCQEWSVTFSVRS